MTATTTAEAPDPVVLGYARALFEVARVEGVVDRVEDELFSFGRALEGNAELRERLGDARLGTAARLEIVDELLGGRAHPTTVAAIGFLLQAGRVRQLPTIGDALAQLAADARSQVLAEVRSAVPLDDEQRARLAGALHQATGKQVSVKVIVDPNVVGGLVVTMGDTVIDGSVARRLEQMRTALVGA